MPSPGDAHPVPPITTSAGGSSSSYDLRKRVSNGQLNASNRYSIPLPPASPSPPPTPQTPTKKARKRRSVQSLKASDVASSTAVSLGPNANTTTLNDMTTLVADGIVHSAHRTPHSARFPRPPGDDEEEVLIGLLSGTNTAQAGAGRAHGMDAVEEESDDGMEGKKAAGPMSTRDKYAIALLIVLYLIQGIPIGLAFGSIPFLLKSKLSYSQLGTFSLATFPYSLKLLHAPIVDAIFHPKLGRRKSWIIPIQIIMGSLMIWMGNNAAVLFETEHPPVNYLTAVFTLLIFFAATQDIAVDGWALTLLSQENLSYASTAQTAGLNSGYFLSFTVFLALNSTEFANKYFRTVPSEVPLLSLAAYLRFWGLVSFAVSLWLFLFKREDPVKGDEDDLHLGRIYKSMWEVCKLKHVQLLCVVHLLAKIGFQTHEAATNLKLVEKGLNKEDLALVVLVDFPFQIIGGWLAARWSVGDKALRPWIWGFWGRLGFAVYYMLLLWVFPKPPTPASFFLLLIVSNVLSQFAATVQFVGMSAFHTQIADPMIGGTYMTLLNTISNLGGTWPRFFVLRGVDAFTVATCHVDSSLAKSSKLVAAGAECVSEAGKALCKESGGTCVIERDGYYIMSSICVGLAVILLVTFILPTAKMLQALPLQKWRLKSMPL